jgi:hypothetical protein
MPPRKVSIELHRQPWIYSNYLNILILLIFFFDPASSKSWTTSESRRQDRFKHRTGGSYFIEKTELGHQKLEESYISYLLNPNGHGGRILFAESVIKVKQEF